MDLENIWKEPCVNEYVHDIRAFIKDKGSYRLPHAITLKHKGGFDIKARWIEIDNETEDVFCIVTKEPDEVDCAMLSDMETDSIYQLFQSVVINEINKGFNWKEYAYGIIKEKHPDIDDDSIRLYVTDHWWPYFSVAHNLKRYEEGVNADF